MTAGRPARGPKHAPRVPFALLVTGLIVGGMALLLALNTASAANELRRHGLATRDDSIAAQVEQLRNEVAASSAPANVAAAAAALGMVPDGNPAFIVVGSDGTVRVLGEPAQASEPPVAVPHPTSHKRATKKPSARATTSASKSAAKSASSSPAKPKPAPSPRPTPTPTVTLPGGTR